MSLQDPRPVPAQDLPENQDEGVKGFHIDQYGRKVNSDTGELWEDENQRQGMQQGEQQDGQQEPQPRPAAEAPEPTVRRRKGE